MWRAIGGVVLGYAAIVILVISTTWLGSTAMGPDRVYKPGTYEASGLWLAVSFVLSFVAAIVGGYVCAAISRSWNAVLILALILLVFGLAFAVPLLLFDQGPPQPRTPDAPEGPQAPKQPPWVALLNPLIGAAGVLLGSRLKGTAARPSSVP